MATEEGGRERGREEGVVVFNDFRPRGLRHGARDVGGGVCPYLDPREGG